MSNIAITNYCNLKCPYCFADDMIQCQSGSMDPEQFEEIFRWMVKIPQSVIGVIGGEPTLHPKFDAIIDKVNKLTRELNTRAVIFTNGVELNKYVHLFGDRVSFLINCNSPTSMGVDNFYKMTECLDRINTLAWFDERASLGCNLYMSEKDYSYIWKFVDKYGLHGLRTSVTAPSAEWRSSKEEYYYTMKDKFLDFCRQGLDHHCEIHIDCGHIPDCYFTKDEMELVNMATGGFYLTNDYFCEPVIDITSEYTATACFGSWDPIDIRDFDNIEQLRRYLLVKKSYPRAQDNCSGKCSTCKKHELLICQGGCLGFAGGHC